MQVDVSSILTVDVTLALVGLSDKEICNMPANMIFVAHGITSKYLLQAGTVSQLSFNVANAGGVVAYVLALTNARSQFCLLIMEIISEAAWP